MLMLVLFDDGIYYICRENRVSNIQGVTCNVKYKDGGRYPARILSRNSDRKVLETLKEEAEFKDDQSDSSTENNNERNSTVEPAYLGKASVQGTTKQTDERIISDTGLISETKNTDVLYDLKKNNKVPESAGVKSPSITQTGADQALMQGLDNIEDDRTVPNAVVVDENKNQSIDSEDPQERDPITEGGIEENSFARPISPAKIFIQENIKNENIPEESKDEINIGTSIDFPRNFRGAKTAGSFLTTSKPAYGVLVHEIVNGIDKNCIPKQEPAIKQNNGDDSNDLRNKDDIAEIVSTEYPTLPPANVSETSIETLNDRQEVQTIPNVIAVEENKKKAIGSDDLQGHDSCNEGVIGRNVSIQPISFPESFICENDDQNVETTIDRNDRSRNSQGSEVVEPFLPTPKPAHDVFFNETEDVIDGNSISSDDLVINQKNEEDSTDHSTNLITIKSADPQTFDEKKKPFIRSIEIVKLGPKYDLAKIVPLGVLPEQAALDKTYPVQPENFDSHSQLTRRSIETSIVPTLSPENCENNERDLTIEKSRNSSCERSSFDPSSTAYKSSDSPTLESIFTESLIDELLDKVTPEKRSEDVFSTTYQISSNSPARAVEVTGSKDELKDTSEIISNGFDNTMTVAAELSIDTSMDQTALLEALKQPLLFSTPNDTENTVDKSVSTHDIGNATFVAGDPTTKIVVRSNTFVDRTETVDETYADTPQNSVKSTRTPTPSVESESDSNYEPSANDSSSHDHSIDEEANNSLNAKRSLSRRSNQNSSLEVSLSINIPGKSTRDDAEMFVTAASGKKGLDRRSYCMYCQKMQTKFVRHLENKHKDVAEVKKFAKLPKGNSERLKIIDTIRKNCMFDFNTNNAVNDGELMVCRRSNANKKMSASDYKTCQSCKGFFSKKNIRHHARTCFGYSGKTSRTLLVLGRKILGRIHADASDVLRKEVFPVLREDDVVRQIRYDRLVILYGNKLCAKYGALQHQHDMIRSQLRLLGRFLCALKAINEDITEFASVYQPKNYDDAILAIYEIAGFDAKTKTYRSPSTAYSMGSLLKKIANLYVFDCIKREDVEQKAKTEDFLKLLMEDIAISVNKNVIETQTLQKRRKKVELPPAKDIQTFHNYLKEKQTLAYRALEKGFEMSKWLELAQTTMIMVQIFNRRRSGEIERILIEDFQNYEGINKEECRKMSKESQEIAKNYVRFTIRGKLGRTVAVLLTTDLLRCMEKILEHRNDANVPSANRYVFGINGTDKTRHLYLRACVLMRKFAKESGIDFPHKMRGTLLRKHIATNCINLNLSENEVADVANFMGHAEKIHREHYRQPILSREIVRMSKILEQAQGGNEDIDDDEDEDDDDEDEDDEHDAHSEDDSGTFLDKTMKVKEVKQRVTTSQRTNGSKAIARKRPYSRITGKASNNDDSEDDENFQNSTALSSKKKKRRSTSPYGPVKTKQRWTAEDKKTIMRLYSSHFRLRTFPSLKQISQDCSKYPSLAARSPAVIKSWMSNQYKNLKKKTCE